MGKYRGAEGRDHNWFLTERALDAVVWVISLRNPPTKQQIVDQFGVHPSTAWRWKAKFEDIHAMFQARKALLLGKAPIVSGTPTDLQKELGLP